MAAPTTDELAALLRFQHSAMLEMIDIALTAVKESGGSGVGAIHLTTRLNRLADSLKRANGVAAVQLHATALRR